MITLADIFDQPHAVQALARALRHRRLPHGLIFAGPSGVGKATTARALANTFLCPRPVEGASADDLPRPCGQCDACRVSNAGSHPDYRVVVKELIRYHDKSGKSKGIELSATVIKAELVEPANLTPTLGWGRVFVIEQADLMTREAQNALLKTLEEPIGRTLIILLTDLPSMLLPTIHSRSQMLRFGPLPASRVDAELRARGVESAMAEAAARLADGSLGLALKWIDDGVVPSGRELQQVLEQLFAGRPLDVDLPTWFKSAAEKYANRQLQHDPLGSKDQATREGLALYLKLASDVFRRGLSRTDDPGALERACDAIESLVRAEQYLDANVNIPLIFQQLQLSLARGG